MLRHPASVAIALVLAISGCGFEYEVPVAPGSDLGSESGGSNIVLHMPVPQGQSLRCTQGAGGSYSHNVTSTRYDIDLDTSNSSDEEVYAPIAGVAHVHTDSASSGFGYHVNIDIGNNMYVVLAHFKEIFISDGSEVAVGQLIGYEGCTGNCTGDHIHLGLHEGDASDDALLGTSIQVSYLLTDTNAEHPQEEIVNGDDLVCGMDDLLGHVYKSSLPVIMWHPDGTLIKVPNDPKVYVLDGGRKHWMEDEQVFWSYNFDFDNLTLVSDSERDCYQSTTDLTEETQIEAVMDGWGDVWLLVGQDSDPDAYKVRVQETAWEDVLSSWGLSYTQSTIPHDGNLSESMLSRETLDGYAGFRDGVLVTEQSSSDVYVISHSVAVPIKDWETYLMLGFFDREILWVNDGVVRQIHENVGSCTGGIWCLDQEAITSCGGGFDLGSGGNYGGDSGEDQDDDDVVDDSEDQPQDQVDDDQTDDQVQDDPEEEVEEDPQDEEEPEDELEPDESDPVQDCSGEDACIADMDSDGIPETLLMVQDQWLSTMISGLPAFVYGNGGCFDGTLSMGDLVYASDSYYQINFSRFATGCSVELSLISSMGADGAVPASNMSNWLWWQNVSFCTAGSELCELMDNGTAWEEWLLKVEWNTSLGLMAQGNGFTSNDEL